MKKPTLCCCLTWTIFIELNFTVVFLLIRKAWDDWFAGGKVERWGILRNGVGGMILKWRGGGVWYPFTDYDLWKSWGIQLYNQSKLYKEKVIMILSLEKVFLLWTLLYIKNLIHFHSVIYIDKTHIAAISRLLIHTTEHI